MDGRAGRPSDNLPSSDWLGVYPRTTPELTVRVYWQPGPPICQRFGLDSDLDQKWRSGIVDNTCPWYLASRVELLVLREWHEENMLKGFIWQPSSPLVAPSLFPTCQVLVFGFALITKIQTVTLWKMGIHCTWYEKSWTSFNMWWYIYNTLFEGHIIWYELMKKIYICEHLKPSMACLNLQLCSLGHQIHLRISCDILILTSGKHWMIVLKHG